MHLSSVQFKLVSIMHSEKTIKLCAPPRLSEVSPTLALEQFQCSSDWRWSFLVLGRSSSSLFSRLSPSSDRWCDVFDFVPEGSASSSSTVKISWDAIRLRWLLFPPVYLLGPFPFGVVEVLLYVHTNHRRIRDGSPGRPSRLSHSSGALSFPLTLSPGVTLS